MQRARRQRQELRNDERRHDREQHTADGALDGLFRRKMRRHFVTPQRAAGEICPGIADPDHDENAHQKPCAAVQQSQRDHVQRQPGAVGVDERQIHHLRQPGARISEDRLRHHQHIDDRKDEAQLLRHEGVDSERHQHIHEAENEKAPL